jgi:arylsulfatase A-like enzyme/Flp pilus assembly protein TadD
MSFEDPVNERGHLVRARVVWLALALVLGCGDGAKPSARNVLLITIDTLRADALGAYGSQSGASPHLYEFARRGVLFEQAHASCPNTLPSHASILTGLHPYHHRVRENGVNQLAERYTTLAERFSEAGYATAAETADVVLARQTGIAQGFARFRDIEARGVELQRLRVTRDGKLSDPSVATDSADARIVDLHTRSAADITRAGIAFLHEPRSGPFFLWLHYFDPHWPHAPPAPFASRFSSAYAGEVAYTDENVVRVLEELEHLGLDETTLVVVTGDHGEGLGDHSESRHGYLLYQSTVHVPLLFVGPRVPSGRRVAAPVESVDIAPTVLAWAGLAPESGADGVSLLTAFDGQELPERLVYGESVSLRRLLDVSPLRFVREGRWKLIHEPTPELYDLDADPAEAHDLAAGEGARVKQLREQLAQLLARPGETTADSQREIDEQTRRQLETLGYVVGGSTPSDDPALDSLDVHGPDPARAVARLDPYIDALGSAQFADARETASLLEKLSREFPESSGILEMLIDAQLAAGRAEGAVVSLQRGTQIDPDHQRYWSNLGELLARLGRDGEAKAALTKTLRRWPCDLASRTNLAAVHSRAGNRAAQIQVLEQGIAACDSPPGLMNDLAYQLATTPAAKLRDGKRALELAEKMIRSLRDNPLALDTVAVAQAEIGQRDEARSTLAQAIAMAERQKVAEPALKLLREHAAKVEAGEPIRE